MELTKRNKVITWRAWQSLKFLIHSQRGEKSNQNRNDVTSSGRSLSCLRRSDKKSRNFESGLPFCSFLFKKKAKKNRVEDATAPPTPRNAFSFSSTQAPTVCIFLYGTNFFFLLIFFSFVERYFSTVTGRHPQHLHPAPQQPANDRLVRWAA